MRNIIAAAVLSLILLAGCQQRPAPSQAEKNQATVVSLLPPNHTDLKDLGNQWYSFNLEVAGSKRSFMVRYWTGSHCEIGITVTELK